MFRGWITTAATVLIIAGLSYAAYESLRPPPLPPGVLYGNGHIESTEISISAEVAGRVVENRLKEGESVGAGSLLVRLDDAELMARLAQAEAEVSALQKAWQRIQSELRTWRHHLLTATEDIERIRRLYHQGSVSDQQRNAAEDRFQEVRGRVAALEAQRDETHARKKAATQNAKVLRLQLAKTVIRSPVSGTVLSKAIEQGELASPGRVIAVIADLSTLDLRVFIPEADIGKIALGDPARVRVDAFPDRYLTASVAQVDQQAQFTPRDIHLPEERVRMVFGVKLALDNPERIFKPGMPADAWILWQDEAGWPDNLVVPQ